MNPFENLSKRWMRKQLPTSDKETLDRDLLRQDILLGGGVFVVGVLLCLLVVRCTRPSESQKAPKPSEAAQGAHRPGEEEPDHMIYFPGSQKTTQVKIGASSALPRGTLVRVRLLNSLQTFETVPAFVQIVDYALGRSRYGATLLGDAVGDASIERIKIAFNTLKLPRPARSVEIEGQALSLDGTLGIRAEKLEGFMGRALTSGAQAGTAGLGGLEGGVKGDLNQFLAKALLSGLQTELSSDLSAARNRGIALSLDPGVEFYVQLTTDFSEDAR